MSAGWPHEISPFHVGERDAQERTGAREAIESVGRRIVRAEMPDQHRVFFEALPWLVLGATDREGRPWASVVAGEPGFLHSPTSRSLVIDAMPSADDPIVDALREGAPMGLLGIDFATRRRNRMNGVIASRTENQLEVAVAQSFGNCPKYIQKRRLSPSLESHERGAAVRTSGALDADMAEAFRSADTFFIASVAAGEAPNLGCDVSHRGGRPGFVEVSDDGKTLRFPDFEGNYLFNTLGNLLVEPRAGLVVVDFDAGHVVQVTGRATIVWHGPEVEAFEGAQRVVRFEVTEAVRREGAFPLRGELLEMSPTLEETGSW